ncbi:MAG: DNA repair protein RadA [Tepidiformaceae bacterium]
MARTQRGYRCNECGREFPAFQGRCPGCDRWNTLEAYERAAAPAATARRNPSSPLLVPLTDVADEPGRRYRTAIDEFDRVLGGGIVPGSVTLVGGDPGIGKSTLMLQAAARLAAGGALVAYVCGEESPRQVKLRGSRLGIGGENIVLIPETGIEQALGAALSAEAAVVIVDSIQSVYVEGIESRAGGPAQLAEAGARLVAWSKANDIATVLTGHVTKTGDIAGPRLLEHLVDVVLSFEGAEQGALRVLRAVKNRFGATDEVGVFEMTGTGLASVDNPSLAFVGATTSMASGCAITAVIEGTRPIAVEVQALAVNSHLAAPRRVASGIEASRLHLLLAVLARRAGIDAGNMDVVTTVSAGLRLRDPAADLAILVALASAVRDRPLTPHTALLGEVALSGSVRPVQQAQRRLVELSRLGVRRVIGPPGLDPVEGVAVVPVATVREAIAAALS